MPYGFRLVFESTSLPFELVDLIWEKLTLPEQWFLRRLGYELRTGVILQAGGLGIRRRLKPEERPSVYVCKREYCKDCGVKEEDLVCPPSIPPLLQMTKILAFQPGKYNEIYQVLEIYIQPDIASARRYSLSEDLVVHRPDLYMNAQGWQLRKTSKELSLPRGTHAVLIDIDTQEVLCNESDPMVRGSCSCPGEYISKLLLCWSWSPWRHVPDKHIDEQCPDCDYPTSTNSKFKELALLNKLFGTEAVVDRFGLRCISHV